MPELGSNTSTVPVFWATFGIFSARSKWFPVAIGDHGRNLVISLRPGDKATMEWRHSGSPRPKNFRVQKSAGTFLAAIFLGSRRHPPYWVSSKGPNYQRWILLIAAGAIEGHFEGKMPRDGHQEGLVFARQCPGSPGTWNPEETGPPGPPVSWSQPYSPDLAPSDYHLFPGLKKQLKGRHFSSDAEVIAAAETWFDGQPSEVFFLSGFQKLEQRAKKCIELRGEYVK